MSGEIHNKHLGRSYYPVSTPVRTAKRSGTELLAELIANNPDPAAAAQGELMHNEQNACAALHLSRVIQAK